MWEQERWLWALQMLLLLPEPAGPFGDPNDSSLAWAIPLGYPMSLAMSANPQKNSNCKRKLNSLS